VSSGPSGSTDAEDEGGGSGLISVPSVIVVAEKPVDPPMAGMSTPVAAANATPKLRSAASCAPVRPGAMMVAELSIRVTDNCPG
jgi:hypothetical protein